MRKMQTRFVADISKYTENFFLGMSPRQTVFGITGGAVILLGTYFLPIPQVIPMLIGFLIIMVGFFQPEGMPLEKYLQAWWDSHFTNPIRRHYESDNIVYDFLWRGEIGGRTCFRPADYLKDEPAQTAPDGTDKNAKEKNVRKLDVGMADSELQEDEPWRLTPEERDGKTRKQIDKEEKARYKQYQKACAAERRAEEAKKRQEAKAERLAQKAQQKRRPKTTAQTEGAAEDVPATDTIEADKEYNVDYRSPRTRKKLSEDITPPVPMDGESGDWTDVGGGNGSGYSAQDADVAEAPNEPTDAQSAVSGAAESVSGRSDEMQASMNTETPEAENLPVQVQDVDDEPSAEITEEEPADAAEAEPEDEPADAAEDEPEDEPADAADDEPEDSAEDDPDSGNEPPDDPEDVDDDEASSLTPAQQIAAERIRAMQAKLRRGRPGGAPHQTVSLQGGRSRQVGDYAIHRRK